MSWIPNESTLAAIQGYLTTLMYRLPYIIGIDELINDCEVVHMDPEGVGTHIFPRYLTVTIKRYHQLVVYRGFPEIAVGDIVTVAHFRQGDLYEIIGIGGATGDVTFPLSRLGSYCRGCIIRGGATEWETHFAGGAGYAITGDGVDVFSILSPTWEGTHTWRIGINPTYMYVNPSATRTYILEHLGVGTQDTTNAQVTIQDTSVQLRLEYPGLYPDSVDFTVDASGNLTISPSGSYVLIDEDLHLDANIGDSPKLRFYTGDNDSIDLFAEEGLSYGTADLIMQLADADGDSRFAVRERGLYSHDVFWIDSLGQGFVESDVVIGDTFAGNDEGVLNVCQDQVLRADPVLYLYQACKTAEIMYIEGISQLNKSFRTLVVSDDMSGPTIAAYTLVYVKDNGPRIVDGWYWIALYDEAT